jgi:hypothetical protein
MPAAQSEGAEPTHGGKWPSIAVRFRTGLQLAPEDLRHHCFFELCASDHSTVCSVVGAERFIPAGVPPTYSQPMQHRSSKCLETATQGGGLLPRTPRIAPPRFVGAVVSLEGEACSRESPGPWHSGILSGGFDMTVAVCPPRQMGAQAPSATPGRIRCPDQPLQGGQSLSGRLKAAAQPG